MAGHRAATSIAATLGVAAATLLVVGGILAGPSILECSRDTDGFGACLRDKVAETGLIAPDGESLEQPEIVAEIPSEPSLPPTPTGWMEARANEYEPALNLPVDLAASPAGLAAIPLSTEAEVPVAVAVAPTTELATTALAPVGEVASVTLDGPAVDLAAEGASSSGLSETAQVALIGPEGQVAATGPVLDAPIEGAVVLAQPGGLTVDAAAAEPATNATITPEPIEAPVTLTVAAPTPSEPAPVDLIAEMSAEPVLDAPSLVIEFNPQYPNVLMLPPPASGDDSSFRSLQLN